MTDTTPQPADEVDADTVAARAAQVIASMGAEIRALTAERDRYRGAWQSARFRAQAYGEGILQTVKDRESYQGWLKQAEARIRQLERPAVEAKRAEIREQFATWPPHATIPSLLAEIDRLRTDAAAALLPAWEAMYEPGNVSDYLIGYANSEAGAKGAAEAWMRSEAEVVGRLEWVPQNPLDGYDQEFDLVERHDDGIDTGPGITVRRRRGTAPAGA